MQVTLWTKVVNMKLKGILFKQYIIIMSYYFFDYLITIYHCKNPLDEWNKIARSLMIIFNNIPLGMTVFFLGYSLMWYIVLIIISIIIEKAKKNENRTWYKIYTAINFITFSLICGFDFGFGATSWFWHVDLFYRIALGTFLYVILYFCWISRD